MDGEWKIYNEDGKISRISIYSKGVFLKSTDYLLNKEKEGKMVPYVYRLVKEYFPDGSIKKEEEFPGHGE